MLKVHFGMHWGRIRLADHPVPVLERVLMLLELRNHPQRRGDDRRTLVPATIPASARSLLFAVSSGDRAGDPLWSSVRTMFDDDVARRTAIASRYGVARMLDSLSPNLRLDGDVLEIPSAREEHVHLNSNGLVLMPSAFWTGRPLLIGDTQYVLIYPADHGPADEWNPAENDPIRDALGGLLGPTRAKVLRALREPHTTSSLAEHTRISRSSASEHATALRTAGLITSRREGRGVRHRLTGVGRSLLEANAQRRTSPALVLPAAPHPEPALRVPRRGPADASRYLLR